MITICRKMAVQFFVCLLFIRQTAHQSSADTRDLRQLVKVVVTLDNDEKEIREYPAAELRFKPRRKKKDVRLSKEEMKELKALEEKNGASKLNDD